MTTQTLATADGILRDFYTDLVIEQTNYKTYMLDRVEADSTHVDFEGRRAVFSVESAPNQSHGAIVDGGTLPNTGQENYAAGIVNIKYLAGGFEISDQAAKAGKGKGVNGMSSLLDRGTRALQKRFRKNVNRVIFGDGTGLLASMTAGATSATQTVDSVQYVQIGEEVDVVTRSNGTVVSAGLKVIARNPAAKTVTFSASLTATTNEGIYLAGSYGIESDGLRNMTSRSRVLHSIDSSVAGNEYWNGNEVQVNGGTKPATPAAGNIAGESSFIKLADAVGAGGEDDVGMFLTTRGVRNRLASTYQSQKRFNDARAVDIHGGYTAIFVNEIPVIYDDDVPKGYAFALPNEMDVFTWHEVAPADWLSDPKTGLVWHLANSTTVLGRKRAAWQAWFVWYAALGLTAPNRTGRIPDAQDEDPS
jgi:hypothetical protein